VIEKKIFGKTGHESTRTIFGAAALSKVTQYEADKTLDLLLHYKINHIDTAASYGDSELRIGPWMNEHRNNFFLATKTEKRSYKQAKEELYRSLDRLKVDSIDLWQIHFLVDNDEWETAMSPGGALDAFIEAKEEGLTKYLGVTGHGLTVPGMHIKSLNKYNFDSILLPYSYIMMQNPNYAQDFNDLSELCREKNIAMQTIKSISKGPLDNMTAKHAVWYDPLDNKESIENAVHWVLGNSQVFLNTVGDIHLLKIVLEAAVNFQQRPHYNIMQNDLEKYEIKNLFSE